MKIRPLGERVLIKQTKQEETTKSGIVLPDTASKEKPIIGEVTAVGDAIKEISSELLHGECIAIGMVKEVR